jgi:hypothetical protein
MENVRREQFEEPTLTEQGSLTEVTLVSPSDGGGDAGEPT